MLRNVPRFDLAVERDDDSPDSVASFEDVVILGSSNVPIRFEKDSNHILLPYQ
jgi:hypothetical protein